jgi:hypothetical protein
LDQTISSGSVEENLITKTISKAPKLFSHGVDCFSETKTLEPPLDLVQVADPFTGFTDGNQAMQLRDRRKLVVPRLGSRDLLGLNPFAVLATDDVDISYCGGISDIDPPTCIDGSRFESDSSLVLLVSEQQVELVGQGEWDEEVLWVEPLAITHPSEESSLDLGFSVEVALPASSSTVASLEPCSDWVMDHLTGFGEFLGASYKGMKIVLFRY